MIVHGISVRRRALNDVSRCVGSARVVTSIFDRITREARREDGGGECIFEQVRGSA
jgi:hypothetical protein